MCTKLRNPLPYWVIFSSLPGVVGHKDWMCTVKQLQRVNIDEKNSMTTCVQIKKYIILLSHYPKSKLLCIKENDVYESLLISISEIKG